MDDVNIFVENFPGTTEKVLEWGSRFFLLRSASFDQRIRFGLAGLESYFYGYRTKIVDWKNCEPIYCRIANLGKSYCENLDFLPQDIV